MKISEILKKDVPSLSFEVFPPKTDSALDSIRAATEEIASLSPAFMSVTYGAGGGTSKYTLQIAENIEKRYGVTTVAHLTCVSSTRDTVRARIEDMKAAGIRNVMALRGDIPQDMVGLDRTGWDYAHAVQLVRELKESDGDFCIGGACYPEVHPESKSAIEDLRYVKEKVDAGCDFLTTQMFFDNRLFYDFLDRTCGVGIEIPIIPGIMPITRVSQIDRAIKLSGSYVPKEFLSLLEKYGADSDEFVNVGIDYAVNQIRDLFAHGVKNAHVYTMNKPYVARQILRQLSDLLN